MRKRSGETWWSHCLFCQTMDREVDCSCCQEMGSAKAMMSERARCIVEEADFKTVCLNKAVLQVCM